MKKLSLLAVLMLVGCAPGNRQELVTRFQEAYPNTWQKELLEYDIKQGNTEKDRDFWDGMQVFLDAREENIQHVSPQLNGRVNITNPPRNSTEYQEELARKKLYGF